MIYIETDYGIYKIDSKNLTKDDISKIEEYLDVRFLQEVIYFLIENYEKLGLNKRTLKVFNKLEEDYDLHDIYYVA